MAVTNSWVTGNTIPMSQLRPFSYPSTLSTTKDDSFRRFLLGLGFTAKQNKSFAFSHGRSRNSSRRSSSLCCKCVGNGNGSSCLAWDWNRWNRHFMEIEQAESFASVLKFQLEEAIEKEDFQEAAKLKMAITEATSKDCVAAIMSQLKAAIEEERYHDASRLCKHTGSGLVGWWVGYAKDSDDPFGRLICINPGVGRFVGRTYSPRQLVTASSGTPLFEIYVVKEPDGTYVMQVVYLHRPKGNLVATTNSLSKPSKSQSPPKVDDETAVDIQETDAKTETNDEKNLNVEGATEEGIKSVINFLKDRIPGLKVKVMNIDVAEEVTEDSESIKQFIQDDDETSSEEISEDEAADLEEIQPDAVALGEDSNANEDEKDMDMKLFIGGVMHNENAPSKDEFVRLPAEIKDIEKDAFVLHLPGGSLDQVSGNTSSKVSKVKVTAIAAQSISELMPPEVAKAFWGGNRVSRKISKNVQEIVKLAVAQAEKRNKLPEFTTFSRITTSKGDLDPFDGLYVGAFGPYGTEVVQLRRKYGHWNNSDDNSSEVEFFEYVEAVKLTGDLNVPAGQVTFRAKIGRSSRSSVLFPDDLGVVASYKGQGRIAEFGFKNPKWVNGELLQLNGKGMGPYLKGADLGFLYSVPQQSFLVLFNRLRLPD